MQLLILLATSPSREFATKLLAAILTPLLVGAIVLLRNKIADFLNQLLVKVPVAGEWKTRINRAGTWVDHETAVLHQFLSLVWGTTTLVSGGHTYRVRGDVSGHTVALIYRQTSKHGSDSGGITLSVDPEGAEMMGYEVGYDHDEKAIAPRAYQWTRR